MAQSAAADKEKGGLIDAEARKILLNLCSQFWAKLISSPSHRARRFCCCCCCCGGGGGGGGGGY